jgi:poly(3-hydroxybutyrate) depolymerase
MVKQVRFGSTFLLSLLILCSCVSGQQHKKEAFSNLKIYPAIKCIADTNVSYALFLPSSYSKDKPSPLLILFDSHGDGLLPVNLFSAEAANSGFIIAGSDNSKNGMPTDQTTAIYRTMLTDLSSRLNVNKKAIYLCGFSGGSRVAGAAAITEGGVAGVVGCGAGLPNVNQKPVSAFSYLAVVGKQDFNYTEMQQLDESLDQAGYQHHLLVFDGIHQWPPNETIPDIFTWLRFDAMRQQAIPDDRSEINRFIEKNDKMAVDFEKAAKPAQQQETYIKMMHYLQGLTDVAPLQAEINRLGSEKEVIAFHEKQKQLLEIEQDLQRKYAPEIQQKDVAWWTAESKKLHTLSEKTENPEMSAVYKRVLGYLSLSSYMYSTGTLKQGDIVAASKYIEIYRLVDPTNPEHRYLAAEVDAINHKPDDMFNDLKQAFDLGFTDMNRLKSDPVFNAYHQDERFNNLIGGK